MSQYPFSSFGASESPGVLDFRARTLSLISEFRDLLIVGKENLFRELKANIPRWKHNTKTLASRFIQLVRKPSDLAPLVFSIYSMFLSLIYLVLSGGQAGVEFLYPMSSLTRRQSFGRLARLILDHSRNLQQPNLHQATTAEQGFDPPRVVVIDLNEVRQDVIDIGYIVPADIYGFMIMFMILEILLALYAYILFPFNTDNKYLHILLAKLLFDKRIFVFLANWTVPLLIIALFLGYAVLFGDGTLTLVRRSGFFAPSYAVLRDHEFTVILLGSQSIVEAIVESGFSIDTRLPSVSKLVKEILQIYLRLRYEALKAICNGLFLSFFLGIYLAFRPSVIKASASPVLVTVISGVWLLVQLPEIQRRHPRDWPPICMSLFCLTCVPSWFLFLLPVSEQYLVEPALRVASQWTALSALIPFMLFIYYDEDFPIHSTQFLDILGNPPIRRWEFDTVAAAATFQCLVLCRGLACPIKAFDVLALLEISIPDQTDIWMAWKNRVADRITHEVEILFAPTLPTFGDQRQERLKQLLDQAQVGYDAFREFYDWHVAESTVA